MQRGDLVASGDLTSAENGGDFDTDGVCVPEAGCYTLIVTDGSFPGEVSWTITERHSIQQVEVLVLSLWVLVLLVQKDVDCHSLLTMFLQKLWTW